MPAHQYVGVPFGSKANSGMPFVKEAFYAAIQITFLFRFRGRSRFADAIGLWRHRLHLHGKFLRYVADGPKLPERLQCDRFLHCKYATHAESNEHNRHPTRRNPIFRWGDKVTTVASPARVIPLVAGTSLVFLALLGGLAARAGGAGVMVGALRVTFWGALAMAVTAGVGSLFGTVA